MKRYINIAFSNGNSQLSKSAISRPTSIWKWHFRLRFDTVKGVFSYYRTSGLLLRRKCWLASDSQRAKARHTLCTLCCSSLPVCLCCTLVWPYDQQCYHTLDLVHDHPPKLVALKLYSQ